MDAETEAEFDKFPADVQAAIVRIAGLVRTHGLENVGMPWVRHVCGKLWEMRGRGKDGIGRSLYVTARGRRVVILRSFVKKTRKTPRREIEIALKRAGRLS